MYDVYMTSSMAKWIYALNFDHICLLRYSYLQPLERLDGCVNFSNVAILCRLGYQDCQANECGLGRVFDDPIAWKLTHFAALEVDFLDR